MSLATDQQDRGSDTVLREPCDCTPNGEVQDESLPMVEPC
jgi:hypothetical protein